MPGSSPEVQAQFSRRSILRALALGGAVIAGELWIPGKKVISIPKLSVYAGMDLAFKGSYSEAAVFMSHYGWKRVWWSGEDGKIHVDPVSPRDVYLS